MNDDVREKDQITENFRLSEFDCGCGCEMPGEVLGNVLDVIERLQVVRDVLGEPLFVTSGYRCEAHNKAVGGAKGSYHLTGRAVDVSAPSGVLKHKILLAAMGKDRFEGIGVNKSFIHLDTRKRRLVFAY